MTATQVLTWLCYLGVALAGARWLREPVSVPRAGIVFMLTAVSFFAAGNFAVRTEWNMYPKTWGGFAACNTAVLPFFRNSFASELAGSVRLFGLRRDINSEQWAVNRALLAENRGP